jgi:hypothetical protein
VTAIGIIGGDPNKLNKTGYTKGDLVAADTTGTLQRVPVGPNADVLTADSADTKGVDWQVPSGGGGGSPSNTVVTETSFGQASTAGVAAPYSRGDHTHGTPAAPATISPATTVTSETAFGIAPVVGTGVLYARNDHTHGSPTAPTAASVGAQPLDSDLTTIAGLTATTDSFMQAKASAWSARTVAQVLADLAVPGTTFQPLDSDLTTIASLTATTDNVIQSVASAWASRTPAQLKATLALVKGDVGLGNVDNTSDATKFANTPLTGTTTGTNLTLAGRLLITPDTLTDASTVAVDASLGNHFRLLLTASGHTLGNPTNAVDGQKILFEIIQAAGGGDTLALDTKFAFGLGITSFTMTATANKRDFIGVVYNSSADKFYVIALAQGY